MNRKQWWLRFVVLACGSGLLLTACDITFKRKNDAQPAAMQEDSEKMVVQKPESTPEKKPGDKKSDSTASKKPKKKSTSVLSGFSEQDRKSIGLYFTSPSNAKLLDDIVEQTRVSAAVHDKLTNDSQIPNSVQLYPLPLELEKQLAPLPLHLMRVQIEKKILLIDIKTRFILDSLEL